MLPPIFKAPNHARRAPGLSNSSTPPLIKIINSDSHYVHAVISELHNRCEHTTSGYEHDRGVLHLFYIHLGGVKYDVK